MKIMMKNRYKQLGVLLIGVCLLTSCDDGEHMDTEKVYQMIEEYNQFLKESTNTYTGDWIVDKQVVDTALMRKEKEQFMFVFPEKYLAQKAFHDNTTKMDCHRIQQAVYFVLAGNSEQNSYSNIMGHYNSFDNIEFSGPDGMPVAAPAWMIPESGSYSFAVTREGTQYRIDMSSKESGTAIFDMETMFWSLAIPVDKMVVTNMQTGEQKTEELTSTMMLVFNPKKEIQ